MCQLVLALQHIECITKRAQIEGSLAKKCGLQRIIVRQRITGSPSIAEYEIEYPQRVPVVWCIITNLEQFEVSYE